MIDKERALEGFRESFGHLPENPLTVFSPGRVNIIGEHLDYNGGHVLPCAVSMGNTLVIQRNGSDQVRAVSGNFPEDGLITIDLKELGSIKETFDAGNTSWRSYIIGALIESSYDGEGFDLYVEGDLPAGAGLSSSASLCCGLIFALYTMMGKDIDRRDIAIKARTIEHEYIGVRCGIMDQYAVLFGRKSGLVYLDTHTITHETVPIDLEGRKIVISNTNRRRKLQGSEYNDRREACEKVSELLGSPICHVSPERVKELEGRLPEDVLEKGIYAAEEEERVKNAVAALKDKDMETFGEMMNGSHYGLRDKFRISTDELDFLSDFFRNNGAYGSRMTGGGFGGCTVSIVPDELIPSVLEKAGDEYYSRFGITPTHYVVVPEEGTRII